GDYALLGLANRNEIANAAHVALTQEIDAPGDEPPPNEGDELRKLAADFPIYAAIGIKSRLGATVALTALRELSRDAAPGVVTWSSAPAYRGNEVVAVQVKERDVRVSVYYALLDQAFVMSMNEAVLHEAIDQLLDGPPSVTSAAASGDGTA